MTIYSKNHKIPEQKIITKFEHFWPGLTQNNFWDRQICGGYMTLPKTFPLLSQYMDNLEKGGALSSTYLSLWANTFDLPCVEVRDEELMAMESGFSGQRPVDTWKKRMKSLQKWGFIESISGTREFQFIILPNPHVVVRKIHTDGKELYEIEKRKKIYNIIISKDIDVKGNGFVTYDEINGKHNPTLRIKKRK